MKIFIIIYLCIGIIWGIVSIRVILNKRKDHLEVTYTEDDSEKVNLNLDFYFNNILLTIHNLLSSILLWPTDMAISIMIIIRTYKEFKESE